MNKRIACLLVLVRTMLAGCSPLAPKVAPSEESQRIGTLRLSVLGATSVSDVPSLMALASLEQQGYQTEAIHFAKSSLILPALLKGDLELSGANSTLVGAAIAVQVPPPPPGGGCYSGFSFPAALATGRAIGYTVPAVLGGGPDHFFSNASLTGVPFVCGGQGDGADGVAEPMPTQARERRTVR